MEKKLKHLEFIQNIITRMNANSFLIKGWTITLISALFALSAKDANRNYILISIIILPAFWVLDGFFIATERKFRSLYENVVLQEDEKVSLSMDLKAHHKKTNSWLAGIFSKTLWPFYGIAAVTIALTAYLID